MKFLIDQQLPDGLVGVLTELGHEAVHVKTLGLTEAEADYDIWMKARELNAAVVTKDEDFVVLLGRHGLGAPIVRIRLGNCPNDVLFRPVRQVWALVTEELSTTGLVEVRHAQPGEWYAGGGPDRQGRRR